MEIAPQLTESSVDQLRRLYRFMARSEFVASRQELIEAGFGLSRIENWLRTGRLVKIVRNVYAYGRDIETREASWQAAVRSAGPGSALIGRSACEAWGLITPRGKIQPEIEVGSTHGQSRKLPGRSPAMRGTMVKVARRRFTKEDLRSKGGIYLVRPALGLVDYAADANDRKIRFAFLEACRLGLFGETDLQYSYTRLVGRRGAKLLRPCLALWVPELQRTKSVFEGWHLLIWRERGYPMPEVNVKVWGWEVDHYWPDQNYALELDGDAFHRDPVQKRIDRQKQSFLELRGVTVRRVTFGEFDDDPYGLVDETAMELGFR